jgi:hypothetical protein
MPDVYQIAMELDLDDKASEGLKGITESLTKIVEQLALAKEGFSALNTAVLGAAGAGIILGLTKIATAADKLQDSFARMKQGGMDTMRALAAADAARALVPTTTRDEAAERLRMLFGFMGERAYQYLPQANRIGAVMAFQNDPGGLQAAMQLAAQRGLTAPGRESQLDRFLAEQMRTLEATQGIVTPEKMLMVSRMSGIVGRQMDPEMMNTIMPWLMMTGVGGRLGPGRAFAALAEGALSASRGKAGLGGGQINQQGMLAAFGRQVGQGDIDLLAQNPYRWAERMLPDLQRRGLLGGDQMQNEQFILQMMMRIFKNPQTAMIMSTFFNSLMAGTQGQIAQFAAQRGLAMGPAAAVEAMEATTGEKLKALGASFRTLMEDIALKISPAFNRQVDALRYLFDVLDKWVSATPAPVLQAFAVGLEAIGGALILLTGVKIVAALGAFAVGGWWAVGVAGLVAAVGLLATLDWSSVRKALDSIYQAIYNFLVKIHAITPPDPKPTGQFLIPGPSTPHQAYADTQRRMLGYPSRELPNVPVTREIPGNLPGMAWLPPALQTQANEKASVNLHLSLELDGQVLSSAVAQGMISYSQFPHSGAAANGWSGWPGTDHNILPR